MPSRVIENKVRHFCILKTTRSNKDSDSYFTNYLKWIVKQAGYLEHKVGYFFIILIERGSKDTDSKYTNSLKVTLKGKAGYIGHKVG